MLKDLMHKIFTTHTFGGSKHWNGNHYYPYKKILFEDKHLYSNKYRVMNHLTQDGEPQRTMNEARELDLDEYVFAYLGHHEHYYSAYDGFNTPPFGVFFSKNLEMSTETVVTKFDFASPYVSSNEYANFYNAPFAAREHSVRRIEEEFFGDFFHYWIGPGYRQQKYFDNDAWKWKIEFHYREKVPIFEIIALLWPVIFIAKQNPSDPKSVIFKQDPEYETYREQFRNDKSNRNIKIYPFIWDADTSLERFCFASYIITQYFYDHGTLPGELFFAQAFAHQFPSI